MGERPTASEETKGSGEREKEGSRKRGKEKEGAGSREREKEGSRKRVKEKEGAGRFERVVLKYWVLGSRYFALKISRDYGDGTSSGTTSGQIA